MRLPPGTSIGPYEIIGPLGAGGMGEVYLARDSRLDREVALKILPSRMMHDAEAIARFRQEALTLASLNHPNLATIHGFEQTTDGHQVLVLERIEGVTLAERLSSGALPVEEALQICVQLALALEAAHERGVIHRDVKPGNVMIGPRGLVKVLDFGLARRAVRLRAAAADPRPPAPADTVGTPPAAAALAEAETVIAAPLAGTRPTAATDGFASTTGMTAGTPGYMSPEQILGGELDARSDIFAVGCVLYEALAGRRAFAGKTPVATMRATLDGEPDLSALSERTPARIRALVERCLAKSRDSRPEAMRAVRFALEEALGIRRAAALREGESVGTPHNLPAQATTFVGREATLAACARALDGPRLLTLAGMGGSGKTRLALELARTRLEEYRDGVWFLDLTSLSGPERLVEALAAVLGVRDEPGRPLLEGVIEWLAPRRTLVLLDNSETLLQACAELARRLLASCAELTILVTSREPLGIEAETVFTVPGLELPAARVTSAAAASASESVLLFVERARAAMPAFELTDDNAAAVAEICRRLDGLPLALELAATRVRLLGVEQIRARLDDRFKLLARTGSGVPGRQQTVLAVLQWSWDQLLPLEKHLFRRLAVFTGGWTLERAVAVCSDSGDEFEVLDLLTRLVERALVVVERTPDGDTRYRFLESVWRFALAKLEGSPEHDTLRERHLTTLLELARSAAKQLTGPELARALHRLEPEEENILAALAWCPQAADGVQRGLELAAGIYRMWALRGRFALPLRALTDLLARDRTAAPTKVRQTALLRAGGLALTLMDLAAARPLLEECLALARQWQDRQGLASALAGYGVLAMYEDRLEEALACSRESLALYEELGQTRGVAMALHNIATIEVSLQHPDLGRANFEAALELVRKVHDGPTEALILSGLAVTLSQLGDRDGAGRRLREMFSLLAGFEAVRESVYALEAAAVFLADVGRAAEAAGVLGAAVGAREQLRMLPTPSEQEDLARLRAEIGTAIGAAETDRLMTAGMATELSAAMAAAAAAIGVEPGR